MKNVYAALIKFQGELTPVTKGAENPYFGSKYADLSSILTQVVPLLNKFELGISQCCKVSEFGTILETKIFHTSGEEITSELILPILSDPQKMGSVISYYKRYALQAALGVATANEDDDGNKASLPDAPKIIKVEPKKEAAINKFATQGEVKNPGEFMITFGKKHHNKKLKDIGKEEVTSYLNYIISQNTSPVGSVKDFINTARTYIASV